MLYDFSQAAALSGFWFLNHTYRILLLFQINTDTHKKIKIGRNPSNIQFSIVWVYLGGYEQSKSKINFYFEFILYFVYLWRLG